jgi:hypothetical protein
VDTVWEDSLKAGQKLQNFQILKEESGDGPKIFSVRLTLTNPAKEEVVRYFVFGKEPLWVYRETDYKQLSGT